MDRDRWPYLHRSRHLYSQGDDYRHAPRRHDDYRQEHYRGEELNGRVLDLLNAGLTLWGEPSGYWQPGRSKVSEVSPETNRLFYIHAAAFLEGMAAWMSISVTW